MIEAASTTLPTGATFPFRNFAHGRGRACRFPSSLIATSVAENREATIVTRRKPAIDLKQAFARRAAIVLLRPTCSASNWAVCEAGLCYSASPEKACHERDPENR